ncbi:MAG TPA: SDR family oxidoreductase [Desulfatiglandales bacterium]|nr:SDR family oxidoreductase [Desulfatiglandales bacterium]
MERLKDKVAFITGSSTGIGRASAILFASEGAKVAVADIDQSGGEETAKIISQSGGKAIYLKTDVTDPESVKDAVQETINKFSKLDIIYNNAGGSLTDDGAVTEVSIEVWQKTHSVDLFGTFLCCKYGIPHLIKNRSGSVILTSSIAGLRGWKRSAYTAAKGGIISLTRVMAVDYARYNIRVNCICPGLTITERVGKRFKTNPVTAETLGPLHLLGFAEPMDISYAALYLASDESKIITGSILSVDSGYAAIGRIDKEDILENK